jgi:hypothetical protein
MTHWRVVVRDMAKPEGEKLQQTCTGHSVSSSPNLHVVLAKLYTHAQGTTQPAYEVHAARIRFTRPRAAAQLGVISVTASSDGTSKPSHAATSHMRCASASALLSNHPIPATTQRQPTCPTPPAPAVAALRPGKCKRCHDLTEVGR